MTEFWIGIVGTVVGAAVTLVGQWAKHQWETHKQRERDKSRKAMLTKMLDAVRPTGWRKMETLSRVIGASREEKAFYSYRRLRSLQTRRNYSLAMM